MQSEPRQQRKRQRQVLAIANMTEVQMTTWNCDDVAIIQNVVTYQEFREGVRPSTKGGGAKPAQALAGDP